MILAGCSQGGMFELQPPGLLLQSGCQRSMTVEITDAVVRVTRGCHDGLTAPSP